VPADANPKVRRKKRVTAFPLSPRPSGVVPAAALSEGN
jgi:hypothetical protein